MPGSTIKAGVDVSLKSLRTEDIECLLESLQSIQESTGANLYYIASDQSIRISGSPKDVKYAYGLLVCHMEQMKVSNELRFTLLDEAFATGAQFEEAVFAEGLEEAFVLRPAFPVLASGPKKADPGQAALQQVARELLHELVKITQEEKLTGFKFEVRLGKTYFTKADGVGFSMESRCLSPEAFQQLVHARIVNPELEEMHELSRIDRDLQKLGFKKYSPVKHSVHISHHEVRAKDVVPILWEAKVGDGIWTDTPPGVARHLELAKAHTYERVVAILTSHAVPEELDSRLDIKIFTKDSAERFEIARERIRNRLRYTENDGYFTIEYKEEGQEIPLVYPEASSRKSVTYKRKDVKLTIVEVTENIGSKHWQIKIVTKVFADILHSILIGKEVSVGRMTVELKRFFDIVNEIKEFLALKPSFRYKSESYPNHAESDGYESSSQYSEDNGDTLNTGFSGLKTQGSDAAAKAGQLSEMLQEQRLNHKLGFTSQGSALMFNAADKDLYKDQSISFERFHLSGAPQAVPHSPGPVPTPLSLGSPVVPPRRTHSRLWYYNEGKRSNFKDWKRKAVNTVPPNTPEGGSAVNSPSISPARKTFNADLCALIHPLRPTSSKEGRPGLKEFLDELPMKDVSQEPGEEVEAEEGEEDREADLICLSPHENVIPELVDLEAEDLLLG